MGEGNAGANFPKTWGEGTAKEVWRCFWSQEEAPQQMPPSHIVHPPTHIPDLTPLLSPCLPGALSSSPQPLLGKRTTRQSKLPHSAWVRELPPSDSSSGP